MLIFRGKENNETKGVYVINKIEFSARNLTSNAGLYLLFVNTQKNGFFELIDNELIFENESTNKIKMNHRLR